MITCSVPVDIAVRSPQLQCTLSWQWVFSLRIYVTVETMSTVPIGPRIFAFGSSLSKTSAWVGAALDGGSFHEHRLKLKP